MSHRSVSFSVVFFRFKAYWHHQNYSIVSGVSQIKIRGIYTEAQPNSLCYVRISEACKAKTNYAIEHNLETSPTIDKEKTKPAQSMIQMT